MGRGTKAVGAFVALVVWTALWAPVAAAAPPNDDFGNREDLGVGLPVDVERSNFGASQEVGEPNLEGSGHSVWFSWEAAATGFVTVDTCQNGIGFRPEIAVFTGTALNALTEVAGSFATTGPDCGPGGWGTAVTFKAVAGIDYAIGVDGVASFPGTEQGQGFIHLRLGPTPRPANDDFAAATALSGKIEVDGIYRAGASSYNWNATKESGEPAHGGDPGGASVWYSWTAPASGGYVLIACGRAGSALVGIYVGDTVGALSPVASDGHGCGPLGFSASQGTTYRIAIDGKLEAATGAAAAGSLSVILAQSPASALGVGGPGQASAARGRGKRKPLETTIRKRHVDSARRRASFRFRSSEKESTFHCQLDRRAPTSCKSPKTYGHLRLGRHVFKVYAIDSTSSGDPTPAIARFRISRSAANSGGGRR